MVWCCGLAIACCVVGFFLRVRELIDTILRHRLRAAFRPGRPNGLDLRPLPPNRAELRVKQANDVLCQSQVIPVESKW